LKLFGRKKGRKISLKKINLINNLLPNISLDDKTIFNQILSSEKKKFLEVGFGYGENLIKLSQDRPDWVFLGVEYFINGVASILDKIDTEKIKNIFILYGDGRDFLNKIPKNSISEACILFPDPWHKSKHSERRIIQKNFINTLSKVMKKDSNLHMSSDDPVAQEWILKCFILNNNYEWNIKSVDECFHKPVIFEETKYMRKSILENRNSMWFKFKNIKES
jgi:tRNA (guanine-N7-)-methyltransferase